jgi:flagellar hook assembly protein FlgD
MRTTTHYAYQPTVGAGGSRSRQTSGPPLRRFQVVAEPKQGPGIQITDLRAEPGRGSRLQIQFTLNQAAETTVVVRSLSGREIADVEQRKSRSTGLNAVAWDGRDAQGRPLPPGVYLLEVQALDEEGQQVRAVRSVTLR